MPRPPTLPLAQITTEIGACQNKNGKFTIFDVLGSQLGGRQTPLGNSTELNLRGAYLHVPFCFHKCHYCDFYSIVDSKDRQAAFADRMIRELQAAAPLFTQPISTIFVGGGTPTLLQPALWRTLLEAIKQSLPRMADSEFSVEANPETVTAELLSTLTQGGVNRISVGCQSFNPTHLKTLERWHDPQNVHRTIALLRQAGIANFNLDLIFAVPGQSLEEWLADLDEAISLQPTHISCYGLVYEHNTPLTVKMKAGAIEPTDQDLEAAMYHATIERLAAAGYEHYEISNWAKPGHRCRHNMLYWANANWWPFGPGASGHANGVRWKNIARLGEYLDSPTAFPPATDVEQVDADARIGELFMLGLRLIEGLPLSRVEELLASGDRAATRRIAIDRHLKTGLLTQHNSRLRLSAAGLMLADTVLSDLI